MKKIQLVNGGFTEVDDNTFFLLKQYSWTLDRSRGYVMAVDRNLNERRMHRLIVGAKKGESVDHRDGNKLNNKFSNLRICTHQQNSSNRKLNKNNTSGYKGVSFRQKLGDITLWNAQIRFNGRLKNLGVFIDKKEAAIAYNNAAKKYFGEYANLNTI